ERELGLVSKMDAIRRSRGCMHIPVCGLPELDRSWTGDCRGDVFLAQAGAARRADSLRDLFENLSELGLVAPVLVDSSARRVPAPVEPILIVVEPEHPFA